MIVPVQYVTTVMTARSHCDIDTSFKITSTTSGASINKSCNKWPLNFKLLHQIIHLTEFYTLIIWIFKKLPCPLPVFFGSGEVSPNMLLCELAALFWAAVGVTLSLAGEGVAWAGAGGGVAWSAAGGGADAAAAAGFGVGSPDPNIPDSVRYGFLTTGFGAGSGSPKRLMLVLPPGGHITLRKKI